MAQKVKQKLSADEVLAAARVINKYAFLAHEVAGGRKAGEGALIASGAIAVAFIELANIVLEEVAEPEKKGRG